MVKIVSTFAQPQDSTGKAVDLSPVISGEADQRAFQLIAPGYYRAIIHELGSKTYDAKWGEFKNPDNNGLWQYHALTPNIELLNGETNEGVNSLITRQDVTMGVFFRNNWYRPDGANESPFFKDCQNLLAALGMFSVENGKVSIDGDTDFVIDRPIKVRIGTAGYVAGTKKNLTPKQLTEKFGELNGDDVNFGFEDLPRLTELYNRDMGYIDADGKQVEFITVDSKGNELDEENYIPVRLKLKNVVVGWYTPSSIDIKIAGWYVRDNRIFVSEAHADSFDAIVLASAGDNEEAF